MEHDIKNEPAPRSRPPSQRLSRPNERAQQETRHHIETIFHTADDGRDLTNRTLAQKTLRQWGELKGKIIPIEKLDNLPIVCNRTAEHFIRYDAENHRAVKVLKPDQFGMTIRREQDNEITKATLPEYLRRLHAFNIAFDGDLKIEGVTLLPDDFEENSFTPTLVISQRWEDAADIENPTPTQEEIYDYLKELGFRALPRNYAWYRPEDGLVLADARPDNFVKTPNGIVPIDLLLHSPN